jgi:hypothetical protein
VRTLLYYYSAEWSSELYYGSHYLEIRFDDLYPPETLYFELLDCMSSCYYDGQAETDCHSGDRYEFVALPNETSVIYTFELGNTYEGNL